MIRIAVLMSTYNGEKFLREQIDSILSQIGDFTVDILIRDDGSSDNTTKILNEYADRGLVKWYSGQNLGPAKSFIDLLYHVDAYDYYAFSDQDDVWQTDKLKCGVQMLEPIAQSIPALYCCNAAVVDVDLNVLKKRVREASPIIDVKSILTGSTFFMGCSMLFNDALASIVRHHATPKIISMHDTFILKTCVICGGKLIYDQRPHLLYRQHGRNVLGYSVVSSRKKGMRQIIYKSPVSIADQSKEFLSLYGYLTSDEIREWLNRLCSYKKSFFRRASLFLSCQYHDDSIKHSVKHRLRILAGYM